MTKFNHDGQAITNYDNKFDKSFVLNLIRQAEKIEIEMDNDYFDKK